ncbi:MAG: aspartate aminotransferase family protein [Bacillota bacterium]
MANLWKTNPLSGVTLARGQGATVWDTNGKPYLDLLSGTWSNGLGHAHPRWVEAIQKQASKLVHIGAAFHTTEVEDALTELGEILPPELNHVVFVNTGSEAVDLALKMAHAATGRREVAATQQGYYGATTYTLALSDSKQAASYLPWRGNVRWLPTPHCRCCTLGHGPSCGGEFRCLDPLAELAASGKSEVAAVLYLPVLGSGIIVPPAGYAKRLKELSERCGALLIAEEVTTGMGRTGRWFGFEHEGIIPDILVIGKAIGGGLPIAAVVTTEDVQQRCLGVLTHVQSHQNDPLSGRVAATVISIMQDEHLVERSAEMGLYLMNRLESIRQSGPWITDVRGRGTMVGVELHPEWQPYGANVAQRLLEAGFIADYHAATGTFRLFPPYVITREQVDAFTACFAKILLEI